MTRILTALLCAGVALATTGCKIVRDKPADEKAISADASGDEQRIAQLLDATFESDVLGHVRNSAVDIGALRQAVSGGVDAAGEEFGNRGAGAGAAWAFPVKGEGRVISANMESRARVAELDTDGDGTPDLTLQLGPVFKGTSLRDVTPTFVFTDFRDQIEYARLAREINDRIKNTLTVPEGDLTGQMLGFTGAVSLKTGLEAVVVTPVDIVVAQ